MKLNRKLPRNGGGTGGWIDIRLLDESGGYAVVVELKTPDWDRMTGHRVRPDALRHARQLWRYINSELEDYDVTPSLDYPSSPSDIERKVEAILNERGVQAV